ncbi:MAG: Bax inhibitor-1 family protein, partial [Hylemonella sp.]
MNDQVQTIDAQTRFGAALSQVERNKVLRNTYWLLALSLLPTVLGAWLGVATGITQSLNGILGLVVFLAGAFGFIYAIEKTKHSAAGVPVLLGFTFFMGLMLSRLIAMVLGFSNGASLVMTAFGGTAGVFFVMASLASVITRDLSGLGKWLFVGVIVLLLFAFALDPDRGVLRRVAPGLFWVTVLLSALLAISRSFGIESENAARDGLRLAGLDPSSVFLGKALALAVELAVFEVLLTAG